MEKLIHLVQRYSVIIAVLIVLGSIALVAVMLFPNELGLSSERQPRADAPAAATDVPTGPGTPSRPTAPPLPTPTEGLGLPFTVRSADWELVVERIESLETLDEGEAPLTPTEDGFLVLIGRLRNNGTDPGCMARTEWLLVDRETERAFGVNAQALEQAPALFGEEYPGPFEGLCVDPQEEQVVALFFDVPSTAELDLTFGGENGSRLALGLPDELAHLAFVISIEPTETPVATATFTPKPTATATRTKTATPTLPAESTPIALPSATVEPSAQAVVPATATKQAAATAAATPTATEPPAPTATEASAVVAETAPAPAEETPVPTEPSVAGSGVQGLATASGWHLRAGPGDFHPVLAFVNRGDTLYVQGRDVSNAWLLVNTVEGGRGWISATHIDANDATGDLEVTEELLATPTPLPGEAPVNVEQVSSAAATGSASLPWMQIMVGGSVLGGLALVISLLVGSRHS
ncbi:MAG: SH3 domain-containing protein [Anaerolineae bacterium]